MNCPSNHPLWPIAAIIASVALVTACGGPGVASSPATTTGPSPKATAAGPLPSLIDPGTVKEEAALKQIWTAKGPSQVAWGGMPAFDHEGRIWLSAEGTSEFWIFNRDGTFVEAFGSPGKGDGQFDFRSGPDTEGDIAFLPDGGFYVSEFGNHRVQRFTADRTFVAKWGSFGTDDNQFVKPNQIELDAAGNVYVNDDELLVVKEFTADGTFVRSFGERTYPFFQVTPDGRVYTMSGPDNVLHEYAKDGSEIRSINMAGLMSFESAIVEEADHNLWVGSNIDLAGHSAPDRLLELDPNGKLIHNWAGVGIAGLIFDPDGTRLYTGFSSPNILAAYALPSG